MTVSATKSPNPNPNSRSSETINSMRRSTGGNPFSKTSVVTKPRFSVTPANSPSDFPRRNSFSRENVPSLPRNHGDKENGKEHEFKPARVRSPSPFKGGSKNFMSPTISAASKVTASPKKRILAEKNESIRTSFNSVSFSDVFDFIDVKPEAIPDDKSESKHRLADFKAPLISSSLVFDHKMPSTPKNDSKLRPDDHGLEEDGHKPDLSYIGPSPNVSRASLAPLDADPLTCTYDAETNFTSPRPQFMCYRPNPRIGAYLNKERRGKALEDSFVSGSSSGVESIEETDILCEDSQKDYEVSSEMMQEELVRVFEPHPFGAHMTKESKFQFFRRPKTVAFLLTLLVACLSVSVTDSPVVGLVLKDPSQSNFLYVPSEFTEYAKARFDGLAQNFGIWYAKSLAYLSELVFSLRAHKSGPLTYSNLNLTSLYDDQYTNVLQSDSATGLEKMALVETDQLGDDDSEFEEQEHENVEIEVNEESVVYYDSEIPISELQIGSESIVHDKIEVFEARDVGEVVPEELRITESEAPRTNSFEEGAILENNGLAPEIATTEAEESSESSEIDASIHDSTQSSKTVDFSWLSNEVLNFNFLGICLLALLAAAFYIFATRKGNALANIRSDEPVLAKKFDISPEPDCTNVDHSFHERLVGEPCPSEMSSFQKSSSYMKKGPKDYSSEAQSEERKSRNNYKRESLASSDYSVGSISTYGSFTTYEKISAKHANGEEITPVRRSSRIIRKQVTSP